MFSAANWLLAAGNFCTATRGVSNNVQTVSTFARGNSLAASKTCVWCSEVCSHQVAQAHGVAAPWPAAGLCEPARGAEPLIAEGGQFCKAPFPPLLPLLPGSLVTLIKPACCHWSIRRISVTHTFFLLVLLHLSKAHLHRTKVTRICHG